MATKNETLIEPLILKDIFTYDDGGFLLWRKQERRIGYKESMQEGFPAFTTREKKGYMVGRLCGFHIKAHRAIWAWHNLKWPDDQIDHINGIPWDNRIENLREASNLENCKNRNMSNANTSGWTGVSFNRRRGKWAAKYSKSGVEYYLGCFTCPTKAHFTILKHRTDNGFEYTHGARGRESIGI